MTGDSQALHYITTHGCCCCAELERRLIREKKWNSPKKPEKETIISFLSFFLPTSSWPWICSATLLHVAHTVYTKTTSTPFLIRNIRWIMSVAGIPSTAYHWMQRYSVQSCWTPPKCDIWSPLCMLPEMYQKKTDNCFTCTWAIRRRWTLPSIRRHCRIKKWPESDFTWRKSTSVSFNFTILGHQCLASHSMGHL